MKAIKLCEIVVPTPYILNDNAKCSYQYNIGKYKWMENQIHSSFDGNFGVDPYNCCWTKPLSECEFIDKQNVILLLTHYKAGTTKFDCMNYERQYKPLIDGLTGKGYFEDDNYKILKLAMFTGGGPNEWKNGVFGINKEESSKYSISDYILKMGAEFRMNKTEYKKIGNYDLFQVFILTDFNIGG